MIELKLYNIAELEKLINSEQFYNFKNIPISLHRAKSQFKNPRAEENDKILIIAFNNNEIAGYLGILPDFLFSTEKVKFGWFSCFWVDETLRGEGIGTILVEKALSEWCGKILITEFAPLSKKLYLKTNSFEQSTFLNGIRLYNRFDLQHILPPKRNLFKQIKGLLKITDTVLNSVFDFRFFFIKQKVNSLKIDRITTFDSETQDFINANNTRQLFKRNAVDFEWIIINAWIINSPKIDLLNKKYYFSSVAKSFNYLCYNVLNSNNEIVAFLIFSKREKTLKLPYCIYKIEYLPEIIDVILKEINELKISTFTSYNNEISSELFKRKTNSLFKKKMIREYLISNNLNEYFRSNNFIIQDGDGDCVFT